MFSMSAKSKALYLLSESEKLLDTLKSPEYDYSSVAVGDDAAWHDLLKKRSDIEKQADDLMCEALCVLSGCAK